jgi:hypothetical protein
MSLIIEHEDRQLLRYVLAKSALHENVRRLRSLVHDGIVAVAVLVLGFRREPMPVGDQHLADL